MLTNLTNLGRRLPQRTDYLSVVSPQWNMPEVYTFNPVIEKVNETNLDAFRKPQINASPDVINVTEWIGWLVMPVTQEQELQHRLTEAKSKIVSALWEMVAAWHLASKSWQATAKALIDLYNKIR